MIGKSDTWDYFLRGHNEVATGSLRGRYGVTMGSQWGADKGAMLLSRGEAQLGPQ
jgi:hypothetical protein